MIILQNNYHLVQMVKEKQKTEFQKMEDAYSQWEDFTSKSKIKMRKKMKKDKQQYYDFDYTRGQYYYNFPENHINFATPETQKKFMKSLIQNQMQEFSKTIMHQIQDQFPVQEDMKHLQLYDFLKSYKSKLHERIASLRIRKSFYIRQNQQEKKYIELMQSQIRSLVYRHNKIENIFFKFSKPLNDRIGEKVASLKLKNFDQMHFSEVDKSDFVVYLRMQNVRQRVQYPLDKLINQVQLRLYQKKHEIEGRCYQQRCKKIKALQKKHGQMYIQRRAKIEAHFMQSSPQFLQSQQNLRKIEEYLKSLNFVTQFLKHRNQSGKTFFNATKNLCELSYVPGSEQQIKNKLFFICKFYFPQDMVKNLYEHKRQHLCYRLNYFAAIMLRSISQSHNFLVEIKEKQLHQCRNTMHRELQTIFTNEVDRIFGIPQHEIILLVDQGEYNLPYIPSPLKHQNQAIFEQYFKINNLIQPTVKSIIDLLQSKTQKVIREISQYYAKQVTQKAHLKLRNLSLYYRNLHTDQKSHLISVINEKLFYGLFRDNLLASKIDQIFKVGQLNYNMLQTVYILILVNSIQAKTELDNVLCAQISLMYGLKNRIKLLEYKHNVPFEMSDQFLNRFTQSNKNRQPFQFASKTEQMNNLPYPDNQNFDKIVRRTVNGVTKIQVRRMMPDNPLFQGKKILYKEAVIQSSHILQKIHKTCAYLVQRRQNYLNEQTFSGLIDRFQLVHQILLAERDFQTKKLQFLQELTQTLNLAIQPIAIFKFSNLIIQAKNLQVFHCFSDFHCLEQYNHKAQIFSKKAQIIRNLRIRLIKAEERQAQNFRHKIMKQNHINNVPQISSIYYCDELPMEKESDDIVPQQDDQSYSSMSESQFMANSSKYKSDLSAISSDYHVKTTFKQILGRSAVNAQVQQQNRREELMGKKKKELINDSILGGIITYKNNKTYLHIQKVAQIIQKIEDYYEKNYQKVDAGIEKEYYHQTLNLINDIDDHYIEDHQLLDQSLIHRTLGDINRAITKVAEKIKSSPNVIDHYLFMNSQILKNLVNSSTSTEINDLRGLYTSLNIIQMSVLLQKYEIGTKNERNLLPKVIQKMLKQYSSESLPKQGLMLSNQFLIQKHIDIEAFKIKEKLIKSGLLSLKYSGNYFRYFKSSLLLNYSLITYYRSMLRYFSGLINDYQLLKRQCFAIQQFNCYFALNNDIIKVTNIENKVFVRRKYDFLCSYQHRVLPSPLIKQFLQMPKAQFESFQKFVVLEPENDKNLIENSMRFQNFIVEVALMGLQVILMSRQIISNLKQKKEVQKIQNFCRLLPYVNRYIKISTKDNVLLKQTFYEYYQQLASYEKINSKTQQIGQKKLNIEYFRLSVAGMTKIFSTKTKKNLKDVIQKMMQRKFIEFQPHQMNFQKYYHHIGLQSYIEPYRLHKDENLKQLLDYRVNYKKIVQLRLWIQAKIICFGSTLNTNQLLQLRIMLQHPEHNFHIFWRDQSSQLIKHTDLIKMKFEDVDEITITDQYTLRFLTYQTLKSKYKQFLDSLSDLDLKNEGSQIFNLFYIGYNNFLKTFSFSTPEFLKNYCFSKSLKNQASKFIQFVIQTNPNRYLLNSNLTMTFQLLKTLTWNQFSNPAFRESVTFLDDKCGVMKQILNSNNSKMNQITNELSVHFFHFERVKQMLQFLKVEQTKESQIQYAFFLKKYNDDLLLGNEKLSSLEKYLSKFVQKIVKEKPQMMLVKDEVMDKIYRHKYHQKRVEDKLWNIATKTLNEEVGLFKIILQNYVQKELLRQNKIIKSTLNKVLVPKIIINPYLQSPLILQNYFFAASLKLSYIDSFLNKLKNRAILVQLTEGGFGFLLKIGELDECIQSLCKGVITFTQKQFNDRFRSFLENYDQLNEKYRKSQIQNSNMKSIINICREERGKQLTSQLYNKLDSYLLTFHTKQKTYNSVFNILKSLEIEISKKISESYLSTIRQLEEENKTLKEKFVSFKHILNRSAKMSMEESKDLLYNTFKKEVQGILNKSILRNYVESGEKKYEEQENEAIQVLMKKLRTQKLFYEIKLSNLESKIKYKTQEVNKLSEQLTTLQNTLTSQQYKNTYMNDEIRLLHRKNIEIEELKRQIAKKEEDEVISKFKLIKINQNLQGKLTRLEEKKGPELKIQSQIKKMQQSSYGVQTAFVQSKEKARFRIRTEQSLQHQTPVTNPPKNQIQAIWRDKWQFSERKYQLLMTKIIQSYQRFTMNKNNQMLIEKLREICEQCLNNKIYRKR